MNLLLHVCCAPCSVYTVKTLREKDIQLTGFWYNPNIHPYKEYRKRLDTLEGYAAKEHLPLIVHRDYGLREFLRTVVPQEEKRCILCYRMRLEETARRAAEGGFSAFSSTLFYSIHQNHQLMRSIAEKAAEKYSVAFHYEDFSVGWQEGIDGSIEQKMYRQTWCGCIYSEQERYDNRWKKRRKKELKRQEHAFNTGDSNTQQRQAA